MGFPPAPAPSNKRPNKPTADDLLSLSRMLAEIEILELKNKVLNEQVINLMIENADLKQKRKRKFLRLFA